ncbi:PH domain-containing protein [Clostridium sp. Marseille-P299]|uniref:PH domain-containing protein n=1 Tax=Clostridium sp. Marseille-P299 TaxID=1805477 RepID=UPI000831F4B5|nr:PH domain-containing protein [Clostridium sp. Marseille-P299]
MKFQGKNGAWWYLVMIFFNAMFITAMFSPDKTGGRAGLFIAILLWVICDIFMFHITFKNYILLEEEELIIFFGPVKQRIKYREIVSLKPTHNPLSSLAVSLDRLMIQWRRGSVFVAVKEKQVFIDQLCLKNPEIHVIKK